MTGDTLHWILLVLQILTLIAVVFFRWGAGWGPRR